MTDDRKGDAQFAEEPEQLRRQVADLQRSLRREQAMGRIRSRFLEARRLSELPLELQEVWLEELRGLGIPVNSVSLQVPGSREGYFRSLHLTKRYKYSNTQEDPLAVFPWVEEVWKTGRPAVVDRSLLAAPYFSAQVQSILEVPLPGGGSVGVNSTAKDPFDEEAIRTVQAFAGLVAEGLQRLQDTEDLYQAEQEARTNLALQRVRNEILQMQREEDWLKVAAQFHREVHGLIQCENSSINLIDRAHRRISSYATSADGISVRNQFDSLARPVAQVLETGRPLYRRTRAEIDSYGEHLPAVVNSVLDVPFLGGTIAVNSSRENAFSAPDIHVLEQFAQTMSEAYRRLEDLQVLARRTQELEREVQERRRMDELIQTQRQLGLELSMTRQLDDGLRLCLEAALQVSGMDGGGIYLVDEKTGTLTLRVHQGLSPEFIARVARFEPESANARLVQAGKPLYQAHEDLAIPLNGIRRQEGLRALAAVPVHHESRVIASLNLASRQVDTIPPLARDGLELIASQIGGAIARLRAEQTLRESAEQLRQAQKLEAIGTLAGGVAHDFNNLLQTIITSAELAQLKTDDRAASQEYVAEILRAGHRGADLVSQLLAFSRRATPQRESILLGPLVSETARMLQRTVPATVAIHLEVAADLAPVAADPAQMQQVLTNLCLNAVQAMPVGGELTISLRQVSLDEDYCRRQPEIRPGAYVCLSVRDTGVGMSPQVQERIFEPFFTTKEVGKGTGLGLAMVYGIVQNHEGHIAVDSQEGSGSEFRIYLPALRQRAVLENPPGAAVPRGRHEILLLVEDDDDVLRVEQRCLEQLGYRVLTAGNGVEGLAVYRVHQREIALVVADLDMPKMGGRELCRVLWEIDPAVKVVLLSGYVLDAELEELRSTGARGSIQKPAQLQELGRVVRQVLDAP